VRGDNPTESTLPIEERIPAAPGPDAFRSARRGFCLRRLRLAARPRAKPSVISPGHGALRGRPPRLLIRSYEQAAVRWMTRLRPGNAPSLTNRRVGPGWSGSISGENLGNRGFLCGYVRGYIFAREPLAASIRLMSYIFR